MFFFHKKKPTPEHANDSGNAFAAASKQAGTAGGPAKGCVDDQVVIFAAHDPAFYETGLPATREEMLHFARASGNSLAFNREILLAKNIVMRIHVCSSTVSSWYIAYAIQGAFDNLVATGNVIDYSVIDHALTGEDSEPLRKALALLQGSYPAMHITLWRKVESEASLRRAVSAGTMRMTPKVVFDFVKGLIPIPLSAPGNYSAGEPDDTASVQVYESVYLPLKESLERQGNATALSVLEDTLKGAYAEIELQLGKQANLVLKATNRKLSPDEWKAMPDAEKFSCVIETGMFGITPSILICVDYTELIPNCLALSLLMMASTPNQAAKKQFIDSGDRCNPRFLLAALESLAPCDPEWSFKILTM